MLNVLGIFYEFIYLSYQQTTVIQIRSKMILFIIKYKQFQSVVPSDFKKVEYYYQQNFVLDIEKTSTKLRITHFVIGKGPTTQKLCKSFIFKKKIETSLLYIHYLEFQQFKFSAISQNGIF